eukprot:XP_001706441.1 Hypothetical protein GL50803_127182 [Giardia lamblia ATCC 50803]
MGASMTPQSFAANRGERAESLVFFVAEIRLRRDRHHVSSRVWKPESREGSAEEGGWHENG